MRGFLLLVIAVVVVSCARRVNVEQEQAALMVASTEWGKTGGDLDRFTSFLTPDARLSYWGAPAIEGIDAIRNVIGPLMKLPRFKMIWQPTRATVAASGDLGYTIGTFTMTFPNANGMLITENGKQQTTWKKINGEWKVIEDTGTSDAPLPVLSQPAIVPAGDEQWVDAPPFLRPGAKMAVLVGDPSKPEPFTLRLQLPDGYQIAPHAHSTDEHVTVLSGTFLAATGKTWDDKALADFAPGSYAVVVAGTPHYATAKGTTVLQVHGVGPFVVEYVNPADDPSTKKERAGADWQSAGGVDQMSGGLTRSSPTIRK
jgi:ketosteroid isomerase-like protein/quercetin dioxygenase-like cupin family protein